MTEIKEILPVLIMYMQSDDKHVMEKICWMFSNMMNYGSVDVVKQLIQADHCIEYFIDAMKRIEDRLTGYLMMKALTKCMYVESGLKEVYVNKKLKEIIEKNNHIDKSSTECIKLLTAFANVHNAEEDENNSMENNEFIEKKRKIEEEIIDLVSDSDSE